MSAQRTTTKQPLAKELTDEQIQQLIDEYKADGATTCKVVTETNQPFLVCEWPSPLHHRNTGRSGLTPG